MHEKYMGGIFTVFSGILTTIQTNQVYQIINLIFVIISLLVNIAYTIYKWYKKASSDKHITSDEIEEVLKDVNDEIDDAKTKIENINKEN